MKNWDQSMKDIRFAEMERRVVLYLRLHGSPKKEETIYMSSSDQEIIDAEFRRLDLLELPAEAESNPESTH